MSLNLPKPVNTYAGEDELRKSNNGDAANGGGQEEDVGEYQAPRMSDRYKVGMIYPPKEMRNVIDKTANHVSKSPSPAMLEAKIKEQLKTDPKFAFLNDEDPYHAYYKYMIEKVREDAEDVAKGIIPAPTAGAAAPGGEAENEKLKNLADQVTAYEPKELEFKVDLPGVTAQDLDILRLTALFHARRGRSFLSSLSVREGRNYQFDFLRPTHSLFGYYNRMVESYQKVMNPPEGLIGTLVKETSDPQIKWKTLDEARNRAEWERGKRKREDAKQKERDEEAEAMGLIDWQDFVVVETIEFTQNDMELELPPPTNVEKLKTMSMAEKRMASMVMEETGAGPTALATDNTGGADEVDMEEDDDEGEEIRLQRIKEEQEQARAKEVQRAAMQQRGVKIRTDYVPKGIQRGTGVATSKCPNCGQSIPENELSEHMRIELLDPKWKEQKRQLDMRRNQSLQMAQGTDVSASLRNLASQRTDLFGDEVDEAERRRREEEATRKRKERERIIWDGHTNSAQKTSDTFQTQFSLDEQIKKMHSRMGLSEAEQQQAAVGPQVPNQSQLPPALAADLPTPGGGTAFSGATISAGPTGPSTHEYISAPYQGAPSGGMSAPPAPPSSSSGPSMHPARLAAIQGSSSPAPPPAPQSPMQGQVRPREEDGAGAALAANGNGNGSADEPSAKRAKVEKLAFGLYNEIDWMSLHPEPITLAVQLPSHPEKPEWKLNGSVLSIPDVPVNTLFSTVRDRIKRALEAELPISRMRIEYNGTIMNNQSSLASLNIGDGDMVTMSLKKK